MSHILFFATKNDLLPILKLAEQETALKYTRTDTIATNQPDVYLSAHEIPDLGSASHESSIGGNTFLVSSKKYIIRSEPPIIFEGKQRFAFNQLYNPETVTLTPGGWWKGNILLYGRVATASQHSSSLSLMKLYSKLIRKHFVKVKSYYVGAEALAALKQGKRLTIAAQSPAEFNLSLP